MASRLNIGCGPRLFPGWVNADVLPGIGADVVMDADQAWPWPDNNFDQFYACHMAEHCWDKLHFVREMWRVCRCGAAAQIIVPHFASGDFWRDPTHRSCWCESSLDHFLQGNPYHTAQFIWVYGGVELRKTAFSFEQGVLSWQLIIIKPGRAENAEPPVAIPPVG